METGEMASTSVESRVQSMDFGLKWEGTNAGLGKEVEEKGTSEWKGRESGARERKFIILPADQSWGSWSVEFQLLQPDVTCSCYHGILIRGALG